jgi:hypothetical protein
VLDGASKPMVGDDGSDYGDDYGDDYGGGYGDEDDGGFDQALKDAAGDFGDFGDEGPGYGHRTDDDQNLEEERLIGHLVTAPQSKDVTKRDHMA